MQHNLRTNNFDSLRQQMFVGNYHRAKNNGSGAVKFILALAVVVAAGATYVVWSKNSSKADTNPQVTIVAVTPNYSMIKVPSQNCRNVTTTKSVKNPNSGFFSSMFDSKNHPKYIQQSSSKRVCEQSYRESQVIDNYTISYQFKHYVESMVVATPPLLNQTMRLTDLQKYQIQAVESTNQSSTTQ